jgi:tetratricopeptide (TPR) repeat protein
MRPIGDQSQHFTVALGASWLLAVALPISLSALTGHLWKGLPLLGVALWIVLLRVARWLSPASRADALMRRGRYTEALELADRALALASSGAWVGRRRLVWLNRRTTALLALGQTDVALTAALEAVEFSADPETLGNCAMALLYLNRYEEATEAARLALALTRERSVAGNAALATVMLARNMPAEAEALARAGLADARALIPLVRQEHYAACLCALGRAARLQGRKRASAHALEDLRRASRRAPLMRAMALCEEADSLDDSHEERERALTLLASASGQAAGYIHWFVTQPSTLVGLRRDERLALLAAKAAKASAQLDASAPTLELVTMTLTTAQQSASPRPAPQASREALLMQVLTLGGTFALLIWWTWRFFLIGA